MMRLYWILTMSIAIPYVGPVFNFFSPWNVPLFLKKKKDGDIMSFEIKCLQQFFLFGLLPQIYITFIYSQNTSRILSNHIFNMEVAQYILTFVLQKSRRHRMQ